TDALMDRGLRRNLPTRPVGPASYPVSVRQVAILLHASFRRPLAGSPLRFASTSPPSGCAGAFHPQAVEHARLTGITALQAGVHSLPSPSRPTLTAPRKFSLISGTVLFLSHASADDAFVGELRRALEDLQHPVWVDSRNLRGGSKLAPEIAAA